MRAMNGKAKRIEYLIAQFVNENRKNQGRDPLGGDHVLISAARKHSRDMATNGYVDHRSDTYGGLGDRVPQYDYLAENICQVNGWNQSPATIAGKAVNQWMGSPGHKANLLAKNGKDSGVGVWTSGPLIYVTQIFHNHKRTPIQRRIKSVVSGLTG